MYASQILLLCAKPGDEVLGASAAIMRAREQGCRISVATFTHGLHEVPRWKIWQGNPKNKIERIADANEQIAKALGYNFVAWDRTQGAGYMWSHLNEIAAQIHHLIKRVQPQTLWVPAFMGLCPDRDALNLATALLAAQQRLGCEIYEYAVPAILQDERRYSLHFPKKQGMELALNLSLPEATKRRRNADALQKAGAVLDISETGQELFRPLPRHDYSRPPYGYIAGSVQSPSRKARANGAAVLHRVRPHFISFMRQGAAKVSAAPLGPIESE